MTLVIRGELVLHPQSSDARLAIRNFCSQVTAKLRVLPAGLPALLPGSSRPANALAGRATEHCTLETLGRIGSLEIRLAKGGEIRRAQRLRYRVFYEELAAAGPIAPFVRRDADSFDAVCDHLVVVDAQARRTRWSRAQVVGTYRLLRQDAAQAVGGFYTAGEYRIGDLIRRHPGLRFLELGRSCVLPPYRSKRTLELLWRGIWDYAQRHRADVLIGCASFIGADPDKHAVPLSFLHHHATASEAWRVNALTHRYVEMNRLPLKQVDTKMALRAMPPLIKGYLRLGARVGCGAVVDRQFGTTDVLMVLPVAGIDPRYVGYFGGSPARHAGRTDGAAVDVNSDAA